MSSEQDTTRTRRFPFALLVLGIVVLAGGIFFFLPASSPPAGVAHAAQTDGAGHAFTGERAETETFLAYNRSIELTPEQHEVYREALDGLRAPCCDEYSAATCCCECNMARATWGLAKHLVAEKGYGATEARAAVAEWFDTINPDGFTGDACFTGGCGRAFAENGCGGMRENQLIF